MKEFIWPNDILCDVNCILSKCFQVLGSQNFNSIFKVGGAGYTALQKKPDCRLAQLLVLEVPFILRRAWQRGVPREPNRTSANTKRLSFKFESHFVCQTQRTLMRFAHENLGSKLPQGAAFRSQLGKSPFHTRPYPAIPGHNLRASAADVRPSNLNFQVAPGLRIEDSVSDEVC